MSNYILAQYANRANIDDATYYVMATSDLASLMSEQDVSFGDKAYIVKAGKMCILGNDDKWYWINSGEEVG